ncbi:MAG: sulfotransferase domain-containing protein [SAR324 cluster bacterium]|uniref:Sulfotransferase domain-containing protein n=1 Tax=SAR324 cluster bacterium TaxID=2024889 RepID=A0A7X9FUL3_9DELT|nr:sulfotransferase domain-containing protein [SAR324 cluster bacterium]
MIEKRSLHLLWLKIPLLRNALIALRKRPSILVLSFPRCGSSWVGSIIGRAKKAQYLREPISRMVKVKGLSSIFSETNDDFRRASFQIFSKWPEDNIDYLPFPSLWRPDRLIGGTLVVKEVSLLSTQIFLEFKPKLIFLYRHPAAVAQSLIRSKVMCSSKDFLVSSQKYRESLDLSDDFSLGVSLYAYMLSRTLPYLLSYKDKVFVCFETLCRQPLEIFRQLYEFGGLKFDNTTINTIERLGSFEHQHPFSLLRETRNVPARQFKGISPKMALKARLIWEHFDLPWYREDSDWDEKLFQSCEL